jgi:hypothetical protein
VQRYFDASQSDFLTILLVAQSGFGKVGRPDLPAGRNEPRPAGLYPTGLLFSYG